MLGQEGHIECEEEERQYAKEEREEAKGEWEPCGDERCGQATVLPASMAS